MKFLSSLQVGKLSTGDSLDMSPMDEASIVANDATIKDMEVMSLSVKVQYDGSCEGLEKLVPWHSVVHVWSFCSNYLVDNAVEIDQIVLFWPLICLSRMSLF